MVKNNKNMTNSHQEIYAGFWIRVMAKIGQFIYPWGNGHYSRMIRLNEKLKELGGNEFHYFSKGEIYEKLLERVLAINKLVKLILQRTAKVVVIVN